MGVRPHRGAREMQTTSYILAHIGMARAPVTS
jgi:hypothetical protein